MPPLEKGMQVPKVSITLGKSIDVAHTDNTIEIDGHGKLKFSKGSVEWFPTGKSVNCKKFNWSQFAKLLEENGTPTAVRKNKKAPAKSNAA